MDYSTAIFISIGFLTIVSLGLLYQFFSRFCRREEVDLTASSGSRQTSGAEQSNKVIQVATASPRLCSYKNRRFLASIPNLDRFLCNTLGWQEGVTLESNMGDLSCRNEIRTNTTTTERQPGHARRLNQVDNGRGLHKNQDTQKAENNGPISNTVSSGTTAASTQTNSKRVNSCTRNLAHSILNIVSAIPDISLSSFSQSLPNVHGYLAESVSTSTGSRDLVVLWSTTLESCDSGVLTSTRVE